MSIHLNRRITSYAEFTSWDKLRPIVFRCALHSYFLLLSSELILRANNIRTGVRIINFLIFLVFDILFDIFTLSFFLPRYLINLDRTLVEILSGDDGRGMYSSWYFFNREPT
jgi:hypothetical protein